MKPYTPLSTDRFPLSPPTLTLNNGVEMPQVGLGTFLIPKENLARTLAEAYEMGYRQFDTAWRYYNEREIAQAFKANGIAREEVFITTKVNADALFYFGYWYGKHSIFNIRNFRTIRQAVEQSFDHLQTDYIDLFLVHWPWPLYRKMYAVLTDLYHQGRIRAIGVCSCLPPHLEALKTVSDVVPAVNQFEISPFNTQKALIQHCQQQGIQVQAMSTFSHFRSNKPRLELLQHPQLLPIAEKYNKSVAQIVLRWLLQQDVMVIPKTWNPVYLKENISLFDFSLTPEEMRCIDSLDRGKFLNYNPYTATRGLPRAYRRWKGFSTQSFTE